MKISELSKATNVSVRMIRYYEEKRLLTPKRTASGYRQFTREHIERIHKIKIFKDVGFTIEEMIPLMECEFSAPANGRVCDKLREKIESKVVQIDISIARLIQAKSTLSQYL
jgi:MerR family transcriptional regulator, copper efflux regulator